MSSEVAIRVQGLGKKYRIGGQKARYRSFRETLADAFVAPWRRTFRLLRGQSATAADLMETLWALCDVSFEIQSGDAVGIIGANGAGKSTLLKILSRITEPSEGWAEIRGRVGSLLEVGTGFHPELTGRENIFLNGAILGMRRGEIEGKFDEIAAFAGVERFLDTPIKHYSSGMYLRLAFAVAAHLDPEILLVDEVLAVGDASFRRKCLQKMGSVAQEGRTVLFVSHNMTAVQSLCRRVLVLDGGRIVFDGSAADGISHYLNIHQELSATIDLASRHVSGGTRFLESLTVRAASGVPKSTFEIGEDIVLDFTLCSQEEFEDPQVEVAVTNAVGTRVFTFKPRWQNQTLESFHGRRTARCVLVDVKLMPGRYTLMAQFGSPYKTLEIVENIPVFEIEPSDYWGSGQLPVPITHGVVLQDAIWSWVTPEKPDGSP